MISNIRKGKSRFYGDTTFTRGIARSGYFNKRESLELEEYGLTLQSLSDGSLSPETDEEVQFVFEIQHDGLDLYAVKLWRKYLTVLANSKIRHGFGKSYAKSAGNYDNSDYDGDYDSSDYDD